MYADYQCKIILCTTNNGVIQCTYSSPCQFLLSASATKREVSCHSRGLGIWEGTFRLTHNCMHRPLTWSSRNKCFPAKTQPMIIW